MPSAADILLRARALVRAGELAQAEALTAELHGADRQRGELALALRRDLPQPAVALARALATAGHWDTTVAAALVKYGVDDPRLHGAAESLVVAAFTPLEIHEPTEAFAALEANPASLSAWSAVLRLLILTERPADALKGVRIATDEGTVGANAWMVLVRESLACDVPELATLAADEALERFPDDSDLWAIVALLRLATATPAQARDASDRAIACDPRTGLGWVARWAVAIAEGRTDDAATAAAFVAQLAPVRLTTRSTT